MTAAEVSYAAGEGVLTATLGGAEHVDAAEILDDLALSFDARELGRLVDAQLLVPPPAFQDSAWRTILIGCLGATLGGRCIAAVETRRDVILEELTIPSREWAALREVQWPTLHQSWRQLVMLPPLAERATRTTVHSLVAPCVPTGDGDGLRTLAVLPRSLASHWKLRETIEVTLQGARAHLVVHGAGAHPALSATLLNPRPLSGEPVALRPTGGALTADIALREPLDPRRLPPVLVRLGPPSAVAPTARFLCVLKDAGQTARPLFGLREAAVAGVSFAGVRIGRTADRLYWERTGRPNIEVVVFREGSTLWVRGFAKKARRAKGVRVTCVLRPEAVAALQPNGQTGAGATRLEAEGSVDSEGMFQIRLASVSATRFTGDLLDELQLEIG